MIKIPFLPKDSFNNPSAIINWNPLERCMLMLVLASGLNFLWLAWKAYIFFTPNLHQYINFQILPTLLGINITFLIILLALIYPCYKFRFSDFAQKFFPYFCIAIFVITLVFDGYFVGVASPATTSAIICIASVGLVLFSRNLIYGMLIPSIIALGYLLYQSIIGNIPYAPIFRLDTLTQPYFNSFWLGSMLYFMSPIAICCFILLDIMLRQWRTREQTYQALSQIDPLTRLLNRRSINEYMVKIEHTAQQEATPYCIILMDIDYFKNINDNYGHLKGDEILSNVADVLKINTRPEDLVGRYGGEEFIILIDTSDKELAYQIAERCRTAIMNMNLYSDEIPLAITASFGISYWDATTSYTIQEALHQADVAMYEAKEAGRNLVRFAC